MCKGSLENVFSFKTALSMKENGTHLRESEMDEESKSGQMDLDMKDTGNLIKQMGEGD